MSAAAGRIRPVSADTTAVYGDLLLVDATAGAVVITLPRPSAGLAPVTVKKTDATANTVTVARAGGSMIDGATTFVLSARYQTVQVAGDGTNWMVAARVNAPPAAVTIGVATAGAASATVAFTPHGNGGTAATGYTATSSPGGVTATGTASPINVAGLTNGVAYTFTVHPTNDQGNGPESAASNSVTPSGVATAPDAPTIGTAVAGNTTATVPHTVNGTGGSAITGAVITPYIAGVAQTAQTFMDTATSHSVTGLTNGTAYTFKVALINAVGTGGQSTASNAVTPSVTPGSIPNTVDWWEADQISPQPADNAAISALAPLVGSHSYAQASAGQRPVFKASVAAWNNKPVIRFTAASSHELRTAAPVMTIVDNFTVAVVVAPNSSSGTSPVYCHGNLLSGSGYGIFPGSGSSAGFIAMLMGGVAWDNLDIATTTTPAIIIFRRTAGVMEAWVNGVPATVSSSTSTPGTPVGWSNIGMGNGAYFDGDTAAGWSANASTSKANLNVLGNYWASKYGISWATIT